jgi:DNA-binding response OmpR family regulator
MRVGIVQDEVSQAAVFSHWLQDAGHVCWHFGDGESLIRKFDLLRVDALLLDWNLPRLNGVEVLKRIRRGDRASLPILVVSKRCREDDIVNALRQGADDYLVKPVHQRELLARLEAIVRRSMHRVELLAPIELGALRVDCQNRTVTRSGQPVRMTAKDFDLSVVFLRNLGRILSRAYLLDQVWGPETSVTSRTLDTYISRMRKKLKLSPDNGWQLVASYGRGYRLDRLHPAMELS